MVLRILGKHRPRAGSRPLPRPRPADAARLAQGPARVEDGPDVRRAEGVIIIPPRGVLFVALLFLG